MSTLSELPGRFRVKIPSLIGLKGPGNYIEKEIAALEGVISVTVNHRTGSVLLYFDEMKTSVSLLKAGIKDMIQRSETWEKTLPATSVKPKSSKINSGVSDLLDSVVRLAAPNPYNVILPKVFKILKTTTA